MKKICIVLFILTIIQSGCNSQKNHTLHESKTVETPENSKADAPQIVKIKAVPNVNPPNMIFIKGGNFQMGTSNGMAFEAPVHEVSVNSFWMDKHEITVAEFEKFVKETGYITEGEKIGWSGVFDAKQGGWIKCEKVSWRNPDCGTKKPNPNEPVTQVSWNDAVAFAKWIGKRLPTEAEFEYAIRGGLVQNEYSWGNELKPNGKPVANWWQGDFPDSDKKEDGFNGRAPVMTFPPNGYGLYDMAGNVWEWTADWYADDYYVWGKKDNPAGAATGLEKSIRGGSWLCAENYCTNYRTAGRSKSPIDTSLNNLGFRLVMDE